MKIKLLTLVFLAVAIASLNAQKVSDMVTTNRLTPGAKISVSAQLPGGGYATKAITLDGLKKSLNDAVFPLTLPTFDGLQHVTHPSIVDAGPGGFGGHRYWLGYTPYPGTAQYPASTRENPSIAYSDDMITWSIPTGCPNPLFSWEEAQSLIAVYGIPPIWTFWADSEIFIVGGTNMVMSGKWDSIPGTNPTVWYVKKSTNGVNWTALIPIYTNNATVCQQVVDTGTGLRWFFGQSTTLKYVDSDYNCSNFGSVTTTDLNPWHFDVKKPGANYWCMYNTGVGLTAPSTLRFAVSANGINWTTVTTNAVAKSGYDWDSEGYYKPDFLVNSYATTNITLFAGAAQSAPNGNFLNTNFYFPHWRIGLFQNITIPWTNTYTDPDSRGLVANQDMPDGKKAALLNHAKAETVTASGPIKTLTGFDGPAGQISGIDTNNLSANLISLLGSGGGGGGGVTIVDPDAVAFLVAANITNQTHQAAVNALVQDLKTGGVWTNDAAIYPFVGATSNRHALNLKNPAQYPIVFTSSGVTHDANGITGDGNNGWGDTQINASTILATNNARVFYWLKTSPATNITYIFGANGATDSSKRWFARRESAATTFYTVGDAAGGQIIGSVAPGAYVMQRTNSTGTVGQFNLDGWASMTGTATDIPDRTIALLGYKNGGAATSLSTAGLAGFSIGTAFQTAAQYTNYFNAWQRFQQTLGR